MTDRRVVITGLGVVNALAVDKQHYFDALLAGTVGIKRIEAFDPGRFTSQIGGEAPHPRMNKIVPKAHRKATKLMSRDIELAVIAADAAVRDAKLTTRGTDPDSTPSFDPTRAGTNIGAGLICCDLVELAAAAEHGVTDGKFDYHKWGSEGMQALTPLWLLKYLPNMLGCHVSIIHDLQGPNNNITAAEASGLLALGEAVRVIAHDRADIIIAGAAECKVNPIALMRQCLLNRTSTHYNDKPQQAYRPFDADADGLVVGEGGGLVVLEELSHAQRRGAKIYGEITAAAAACCRSDDFLTPEPSGAGIALALKKALEQAQLSPEKIDLLVPHGLGIASHDRAEAAGIRAAFGTHAAQLPIFATKSRIGNSGAGAAAVDFVAAVLALSHNMIPATVNAENVPEDYGLNIIRENTERPLNHVVTSCYTFGGQTAAVVISRYKP